MNKEVFKTTFAGKELSFEIGRLAGQANGAVRLQYGDTVVLATAVMSGNARSGINYFPLSVEFDEKFYAAGRIKGSRWIKREGRPTDEAILTARLIDRTLRPLFNQRLRNEVQIVITNLSFDNENDPDIVAIIAASCALAISDIPWDGPVGAVRASKGEDKILFNPSYAQRQDNLYDIVVCGPGGFINMVEAKGNQIPEEEIINVISAAQEEVEKIIEYQKEIIQKVGKEKRQDIVPRPNEELKKELQDLVSGKLEEAIEKSEKMELANDLKKEVVAELVERHEKSASVASEADLLFEEEIDRIVHKNVLERKKRADGRTLGEIRKLNVEVGVLPRTHGSGLFERGATQALSILTLGAPGLEQSLESMELVGTKRFMHHYNFPPFSTGETGRMFTGRREIGHGALAEKALEPVIPLKEEFPYAVRLVSEILSSNGSSSMASVCGSTMALMDGGVPIKDIVAGIAMGLIIKDPQKPEEDYAVLTDIQGPEDHHGDMDLKVAGTQKGITALQMDVKMLGVTPKLLSEALGQARKARLEILKAMKKTLEAPRENLSPYAPRILTLQIKPDKIREVIGPGGKVINQISQETEVEIDIEESGLIFITSHNGEKGAQKALEWIRDIVREVEPGEVFTGKVVRLLDFGAFVEVLPGKQGLVHISELTPWHVNKVEDVVKIGDTVKVRVKNIDDEGRINLTMKEFYEGPKPEGAQEKGLVKEKHDSYNKGRKRFRRY